MIPMKKWLVVGMLVLVGAIPALAQYWKNVRSIARPSSGGSFYPFLGKASGNPFDSLFVVYDATGFGSGHDVFQFKRSPNVGVTFSDSIEVTGWGEANTGSERTTAMAHDTHGIHVVVSAQNSGQSGIYYFRSTDGGSTWSTPPYRVDTLSNGLNGDSPAIASDSLGVTVFWINGKWGQALYCRRYDYKAARWDSLPVTIDRSSSCDMPQALAIQYSGGGGPIHKLYVAYARVDTLTSKWLPRCKWSTDFGKTWTDAGIPQPTNFSANNGFTPAPSLTGRNGVDNVYVLYAAKSTAVDSGLRIYSSKVGGSSYSHLTNLPTQIFDQKIPRIAIGPGDTLHAVWVDNREQIHHYNEIYYDRSSDGGQTWIENPTGNHLISRESTQVAYPCYWPDILADGIHQVVVWDSTNTASQGISLMYCKRSQDTLAPAAPTGLQISQETNFLWLSWNSVSGAAGYNVYRANGLPPGPLNFVKLTPQPIQSTVYLDGGVNPNYCYTYHVTAVDGAENEGPAASVSWFGCETGSPLATVDAGTPTPSPYTVRRAGYYTWGSTPDSTVGYDPDSLVYRFRGLTPDSLYILGVGYYEDGSSRGRQQSLNINGVQAHGAIQMPGTPSKMLFLVPKRTYQDSTITVSFVRNQGPNAVVAQLWLYQAHFPNGGGPQSLGVVDLKGAKAKLYDPAPNPSSGSVDISFALAFPGRISLVVFNVAGQRVRTLLDGEQGSGRNSLSWDRKDDAGHLVPGGIYFCRLNAEDAVFTKRITLLR